MPQRWSEKIGSYAEAIRYAQEDGAARVIKCFYRDIHVGLCCPFEGYRFAQLSAKCDPYIFSKNANKYCLRYVGKGLLPDEILENKVKRGNPGVSLRKIISTGLNKAKILRFIEENGDSDIVDSKLMQKHLSDNCFDKYDFLALCLLVFQEKLKNMQIDLNI